MLAVGRDSRGQEALDGPAVRIAGQLGGDVVEFPGGHLGATERSAEFAETLLSVLDRGDAQT